MDSWLIIVTAVLIGVAVLLWITNRMFLSVQKKLAAYIQSNYDKKDILGADTRVNIFGQQSEGGLQIRGNGAFVLTKEEIQILRALPFKKYIIPLKSITGVSFQNSFNGKTVFKKLLCVHYKTVSGPDTIALLIKNPESWKSAIDNLVKT